MKINLGRRGSERTGYVWSLIVTEDNSPALYSVKEWATKEEACAVRRDRLAFRKLELVTFSGKLSVQEVLS